jgi:DNA-binding NarL/FixJ family response regulator
MRLIPSLVSSVLPVLVVFISRSYMHYWFCINILAKLGKSKPIMEVAKEQNVSLRANGFVPVGHLPVEAFTPKEVAVVVALSKGLTPSQIAVLQGTKLTTVRTHIRSIYGKLGVHCVVQALHAARSVGIIQETFFVA